MMACWFLWYRSRSSGAGCYVRVDVGFWRGLYIRQATLGSELMRFQVVSNGKFIALYRLMKQETFTRLMNDLRENDLRLPTPSPPLSNKQLAQRLRHGAKPSRLKG